MIQQTVLRWSKLSAKLLMMQHSVKWSVWAIWAVELVKWVQILNIWEYAFNGEKYSIYAHSTIRLINSRWIFQALDTCMRWNCMEHCKRSIIWSFRKGSAEVDSLHSRNTQLWYYLLPYWRYNAFEAIWHSLAIINHANELNLQILPTPCLRS